jgi:hypothetical protein
MKRQRTFNCWGKGDRHLLPFVTPRADAGFILTARPGGWQLARRFVMILEDRPENKRRDRQQGRFGVRWSIRVGRKITFVLISLERDVFPLAEREEYRKMRNLFFDRY